MLARVANSLYWTGRYLERSEYLARYLKVQYFSIFDAPITQDKAVILRSILYMATDDSAVEEAGKMLLPPEILQLQSQSQNQQTQSQTFELSPEMRLEQQILTTVAFDLDNNASIFSSVKAARENARNIRYAISTELWEAINRYYHYIKNYSVDFYKTRGLYDFTTNVIQNCSFTKSYIDSSLLHDDTWIFLRLGIYLERAAQIIRILNSKIIDTQLLSENEQKNPLTAYQWTITLKVFEVFDMHRKVYKGPIKQENVITFLLTNPQLSRSVAYTLNKVNDLLSRLSFDVSIDSRLAFQVGKLMNSFKFLEYDDIKGDLQGFLNTSLDKIYQLSDLIEEEYFD